MKIRMVNGTPIANIDVIDCSLSNDNNLVIFFTRVNLDFNYTCIRIIFWPLLDRDSFKKYSFVYKMHR